MFQRGKCKTRIPNLNFGINRREIVKKFILKSEQGFTLVELMVVVAIIGILSAIAVPNFKKYQAKSKQSEAKIQLAAVYSAEVGTSADYDTYATCLPEMGYEQSPRGYYIIGFNATYAAASVQFASCTANIAATVATAVPAQALIGTLKFSSPPLNYLAAVNANRTAVLATAAATATQTTFTASAEGSISSSGVNPRDIWTIDNTKSLVNPPGGY
jgi:type IV pilus assembly protein PilA